MVSGRPLLYLSLPGVAFLLGVFWFRRRNKNRIDDRSTDDDAAKKAKVADGDDKIQRSHAKGSLHMANGKLIQNGGGGGSGGMEKVTATAQAMNINGSIPTDENESPTTKLFGKSAPIKIQNKGRILSPGKQHQIDSEILKTKIQDAEHKLLRSIDEDFENMSSPVDLPDSMNNRISFGTRTPTSKVNEPVVIKATRTPKISPENSFFESKYTHKECEQNNNCDSIAECESKAETHAEPTPTTAADETETASSGAEQQPQILNVAQKQPQQPQPQQQQQQQQQQHQEQQQQQQQPEQQTLQQPQQTTVVDSSKVLEDNSSTATANQKRNVDSASPSLSLCSMQSGDSGKGSSLPRSEAAVAKVTYDFLFPISLIGHLYGRRRAFINAVKAQTLTNISLSKSIYANKLCICSIEGADSEIKAALAMIRQRLPTRRYPNLTFKRLHYAVPQTIVPLSNASIHNLQLKLIEGINNDVVVSVVVAGTHLFVQQPLHPSHPSLPTLQKSMFESYAKSETPKLPSLEVSAVCVLPVNGIWYRVQIIKQDATASECCVVKFLDFGGYMSVQFDELRQIRSDFMAVPFQSTECILSNLEPIDKHWSPETGDILSKLTKGIVLQAQVAGYNSHRIPEIYLFANLGPNNVIFINKELVARNLARWVE